MAWYDKGMDAPKLSREVELPRQRSNGAAVVLVAAMAMFTAVAASAFVVRVRMHGSSCTARRPPTVRAPQFTVPLEDRRIEFELVDSPAAAPAVQELDPFHAAMDRGDDEAALQTWLDAPTSSFER